MDDMDNFLDRYQLPNLNQDQINNPNNPIIPNEIAAIIKSLPTKTRTVPEEFGGEFYQMFKEDIILILFKLFHKIETEGTLSNSLYQVAIMLIPKQHKDQTKKENFRPISLIIIHAKILIKFLPIESKNTSKQSLIMIK